MAPPWWSLTARRFTAAMSASPAATIATAGAAAAASLATASYLNAAPVIISDYSASRSADSASARASSIEAQHGRVMSHVASCEGGATGAGSVPAGSGESGGGATGDSGGGSGKEAVRAMGGAGGAEGESAPGVGGAGHQAGSAAIFPLKLLQVHVMFRHGDRAPMPRGTPSEEEVARWEARLQPRPPAHVLPHRQHTRGIEWPFGQLTRKGAREAESLGCALRQRYAALLGLSDAHGSAASAVAAAAAAAAAGNGGVVDATQAAAVSDAAAAQGSGTHSSSNGSSGSDSDSDNNSSSSSSSSSSTAPAASSLISIRSTNFPRTYMTGFYVLQGLLGSQDRAVQVPINIWGEGQENLYENDRCARGVMLWGRAWKDLSRSTRNPDGSFSDLGWRAQYQHVRDSMRSFFNLPDGRFPWLWSVDYADCRRHHGDPLPPGLTPTLLDTFRFHLAQDYMRTFSHQEICRLAMGPLLHEVHESMKAAIARTATTSSDSSHSSSLMPLSSGGGLSPSSPPAAAPPASSPHPRIFLYSGHDATLMPLSVPTLLAPSSLQFHVLSPNLLPASLVSTGTCVRNFEEVGMPTHTPPPGGSWADMPASAAAAAASGGGGAAAAADAAGSAGDGVVLCPWDQFARILEWSEISKEHYERDCHVAKPRL
ncbi:unnamed protein product [Closterium sp. Naga37s-1]|nr:unnamed protein product [Closterium sp. Naga37s-1]